VLKQHRALPAYARHTNETELCTHTIGAARHWGVAAGVLLV
jgi:hypothetical protein